MGVASAEADRYRELGELVHAVVILPIREGHITTTQTAYIVHVYANTQKHAP